MVFPVVGGDGKPTGYEISNSLRFDNPDDPNLSTTFSSAGNRRTFTISAWIKKGDTSADRTLIGQGGTSTGNPRGLIFVGSTLRFTSNTTGSSTEADVETNAKLRDHSAWYHIVVAVDTTQGTAANRIKLYINGEQQTDLATATYPDQNFQMNWNNNVLHTVGRYPNNDAYHMDGHISEFYFIDGTQYAASNFGETDDNGVWIPKDASGDLTFGTNGFYLEFKQTGTGTNSSGMGADTSGNDNHLAVNNLAALDVTVDTPTNNFCTLNPISFPSGLVTHLRDGNLELLTTDSPYGAVPATFALTNGKWYWEIKVNASSDYDRIGLVGTEVPITTSFDFGAANLGGGDKTNLSYKSNDGKTRKDGTDANYGNTYTSGDIIGIAYNADDGDIYFYKNGTVQNSGTAAYTNLDGLTLMPAVGDGVGNAAGQYFCNFGNPTFSISSGNADANGYGNFEYAPPSGYYSLCTKNLAQFG
mgnify:FL=1